MLRRALEADAMVRAGGHGLPQRVGDAGLADARLARHHHQLPLAALGQLPPVQQQPHLLRPPDKDPLVVSARGLESADTPPLAQHLEGHHRLRKALQHLRRQLLQHEEVADDLPGRRRDDHAVRLSDAQQASGEVGRLAHHVDLACDVFARDVAHHDRTGRDARAARYWETVGGRQAAYCCQRQQSGPHTALAGVLARMRVAEVGQHPVAHELGHKPARAADGVGHRAVVIPDQIAKVFRVQQARQRGGIDEIGEEHRQLAPVGRVHHGSRTGSSAPS